RCAENCSSPARAPASQYRAQSHSEKRGAALCNLPPRTDDWMTCPAPEATRFAKTLPDGIARVGCSVPTRPGIRLPEAVHSLAESHTSKKKKACHALH